MGTAAGVPNQDLPETFWRRPIRLQPNSAPTRWLRRRLLTSWECGASANRLRQRLRPRFQRAPARRPSTCARQVAQLGRGGSVHLHYWATGFPENYGAVQSVRSARSRTMGGFSPTERTTSTPSIPSNGATRPPRGKPLDEKKGPNRFEPFWFLGVGYRLRCEAVERSAMMCRALSASCLAWGSKSSALRTSGSLSACALRPSS